MIAARGPLFAPHHAYNDNCLACRARGYGCFYSPPINKEPASMPAPNPKALQAAADGKAPLDYLEPACDAGEARVLRGGDPKRLAAASKPPLHLLERGFLDDTARAMATGEAKYGRRSYVADDAALSTYVGAAMRHLTAFSCGEDADPESGLSHLAHLGASTMILHTLVAVGAEDDRIVRPAVSPEYLAGLLDGEGYLGLIDPRPLQRIHSRVGIQMTVRAPLDRVAAQYGGTIGLNRRAGGGNRKPIYVWVCPRSATLDLLNDALPHMCVKHEQAQLLLDWFGLREPGPADDSDPGAELFARCAKLNRRGR